MSRIFVVRYRYDADESRLAGLRPKRMRYFQELEGAGVLLASGQMLSGDAHGMLLLVAASADAAAAVLDDDPFVTAGVVAHRTIEAWSPTVGVLATEMNQG